MNNISERRVINSIDHTIDDYRVGLRQILEFLPGKDLINCLLVSTTFYREITSNAKYMDKIAFNLVDKQMILAQIVLTKTTRKYKHLKIKSVIECTIDFQPTKFKWQSIHFQDTYFCPYVLKFLRTFTKTVESITFSNCKAFNGNPLELAPLFNKLQNIEFVDTASYDSIKILCKFIVQFKILKSLKIAQGGFGLLTDLLLKFKIKLQKLHLTNPKITNISKTVDAFRTQKDCLKELTMEILDPTSISFCWDELKCLEKITLGAENPEIYGRFNEIKINFTIRSIRLNCESLPLYVYQSLSISSPNLLVFIVSGAKLHDSDKKKAQQYSGIELRKMFNSIKISNPMLK